MNFLNMLVTVVSVILCLVILATTTVTMNKLSIFTTPTRFVVWRSCQIVGSGTLLISIYETGHVPCISEFAFVIACAVSLIPDRRKATWVRNAPTLKPQLKDAK